MDRLSLRQSALEEKLARHIELYTDEAIGECILNNEPIFSAIKKSIQEDEETDFLMAMKELWPYVRQYIHSI